MTCELGRWEDPQNYVKCQNPATHYVMDNHAEGWGGRACLDHAKMFPIQEELHNSVVVNGCWGGFGISQAAYQRLIEWGVPVIDYSDDTEDVEGEIIYRGGLSFNAPDYLWDCWLSDNRSHPLLVRVVRELGKEADGEHAKLRIVEVPSDAEWYIHDYDGQESVHEQHRTW